MSNIVKPIFGGRRSESLAGVIEVRGVLGEAVSELGTQIVGGTWLPGEAISKESDLCDEMGVSRSVIREAFRILGAKGLIRSRTSDGTRVQPRSEWRLLDPDVMDWRIKAGDTNSLLHDLLKVRLVLEPGVVHAATLMASEEARVRVRRAWEVKVHVYTTPDPDYAERRRRFILADLEFHRAFLASVQSDLLSQLFAVIEAALGLLLDMQMSARGYTTQMIGMEESQALHEAVYVEFERRDPVAAEAAMRRLIERAISDAHDGFKQRAP
ncbi:FadR/GntR family transcriptional regulator [Pararhizobium sp. DWP3-4]|uniref:FadR/GntR family transcriptional regulator n=1 Tax=Pararhizobium sp. DWP3-4 TaxID=2804565 RepID=UPI003CFB3F3D